MVRRLVWRLFFQQSNKSHRPRIRLRPCPARRVVGLLPAALPCGASHGPHARSSQQQCRFPSCQDKVTPNPVRRGQRTWISAERGSALQERRVAIRPRIILPSRHNTRLDRVIQGISHDPVELTFPEPVVVTFLFPKMPLPAQQAVALQTGKLFAVFGIPATGVRNLVHSLLGYSSNLAGSPLQRRTISFMRLNSSSFTNWSLANLYPFISFVFRYMSTNMAAIIVI